MRTTTIVWDNHACLPFNDTQQWLPGIERYRKAGVDVVTINIGDSHVPLEVLIRTAAGIRHYVQSHPDRYALGLATSDIRAAKAAGKLAVEGVYALGEQLSLVEFLYQIGVRWMLLVYNRRNLAGGGCHDPEDGGLTDLGRAMLQEMDRVGMIKCCSHSGYRTAREIIDHSDQPVIFSHSNPRRLRDHPRNIPDELIRACAATNGVIGINGVGLFLGDGAPTAEAVVRNIDYVSQLIGAEHVALGLDYMFKGSGVEEPGRESRELWPAEWGYRAGMEFLGPESIPEIAEGLTSLGYSPAAISGILGENLMRVAEAVWKS
jgi:membrane dipeptidase